MTTSQRYRLWSIISITAVAAVAQATVQPAYIAVTVSNAIVDLSGQPIPTGTVSVVATDDQNRPVKVNIAGTQQALGQEISRSILSGSLAQPLLLPNPAVSTPSPLRYRITVRNTAVVPNSISVYSNVIITADANGQWNFASLQTGPTAAKAPSTGTGTTLVAGTDYATPSAVSAVQATMAAAVSAESSRAQAAEQAAQAAATAAANAAKNAGNITTGVVSADRLPGSVINSTAIPAGGTYTIAAKLPPSFAAMGTGSDGTAKEADHSAGDWLTPGAAVQRFAPTYTKSGQGSILGDGNNIAAGLQHITDNTLGRNVGLGDGLNNSIYLRNFHSNLQFHVLATPGISEMHSKVVGKYSPGDFGGERNFWNTICSLTGVADEGCKLHYDALSPVRSYTATLASVLTAGTEIMTTPTDQCDTAASDDPNCSGGQRWLVNKSATPFYAGTVTALTFPSNSAVGTMTLGGSPALTPTVTATIPAGVPDTTNALLGDTVTITVSNASGTLPANSPYCINGPTSAEIDCGTATVSGTTVTLTGHRWPHSNTNGAPTIFFAPPRQAVFTLDRTYTDNGTGSADIGYAVLGNASANSVYWTAIGGGSRTGANLQQFAARYTAAGSNGVTVYDAAFVVTTEDPAKAGQPPIMNYEADAYNAAHPGAGVTAQKGSHDGYMRLGYNTLQLNAGDTLSELLPPTFSVFGQDFNLFPVQFSFNNKVTNTVVNENVPTINPVFLANRHDRTVAGTGMHPLPSIIPVSVYGDGTKVGAFANLSYASMAPRDGWLIEDGCQGGPGVATAGCPNDHEFAAPWTHRSNGDGYFYNLNESANTYGHFGRYAREQFAWKYWTSPNGAPGLVWPQGFTLGFNGCPLTPSGGNASNNVLLGTSQYVYGAIPCTLTSGGALTTETGPVASAATIAPTSALFHITGTTTITTMTPLQGMLRTVGTGTGGCVDFITDAALTLQAGTGPGQFASTYSTTAGMLYHACYTPSTGLWYAK